MHIAAVKQGMTGMTAAELPSVRGVLAEGWHFLLPLAGWWRMLVAGYSPMRVGSTRSARSLAAAAARALWHFFQDGPTMERFVALCRRGIELTLQALELGARNAVAVSMACAVAGIHRGGRRPDGAGPQVSRP